MPTRRFFSNLDKWTVERTLLAATTEGSEHEDYSWSIGSYSLYFWVGFFSFGSKIRCKLNFSVFNIPSFSRTFWVTNSNQPLKNCYSVWQNSWSLVGWMYDANLWLCTRLHAVSDKSSRKEIGIRVLSMTLLDSKSIARALFCKESACCCRHKQKTGKLLAQSR